MSTRVNGQTGAIIQPITIERNLKTGIATTKRWECTSDAYADAVTITLDSLGGWNWRKTYGPKPTVEATFGGDGGDTPGAPEATDTYELAYEQVQKDFLEADHFLVNDLTASHTEGLRKLINDPASYTTDGTPFTGGTLASQAAGEYLWKLWKAGFRSFEIHQPILRLNRTVPRDYNVFYNYQHVDQIYSTSTMQFDADLPPDFLVPLSGIDIQYFNPIRNDGLLVAYGWKKEAPSLAVIANDRKTIQQQYKFGLWDVVLYNVPDVFVK